jgi:hypothetical protein
VSSDRAPSRMATHRLRVVQALNFQVDMNSSSWATIRSRCEGWSYAAWSRSPAHLLIRSVALIYLPHHMAQPTEDLPGSGGDRHREPPEPGHCALSQRLRGGQTILAWTTVTSQRDLLGAVEIDASVERQTASGAGALSSAGRMPWRPAPSTAVKRPTLPRPFAGWLLSQVVHVQCRPREVHEHGAVRDAAGHSIDGQRRDGIG